MQGFAKRGLALVAATSGLVMATAGIASAQASATGGTDHSRGVASGNSLNTPVSVPLNVCGNQVTAISVVERTHGQYCKIGGGQGATAHGGTHRSGGILSGNSLNTAVAVPANVCGNQVTAIAAADHVHGSACTIGTHDWSDGATAVGGTDHSGGILSGNSLNTAVSVPLNLCGNQVGAIGAGNSVGGSDCEIG